MQERNVDVVIDELRRRAGRVKDEVTRLTKSTVKKTNAAIGVTKLRFALNEVEESVRKAYEEIGKAVFEEYLADEPFTEDIIEKCMVVEKYKEEIASLKEKIAAEKESSICPKCGAVNPDGNLYCAKCGEKLEKKEPEEPKQPETEQKYDDEDEVVIEIKSRKTEETTED